MRTSWMVVPVCVVFAGCASTPSGDRSESQRDANAIVVRGSDMAGTLLDGMRSRIPAMTVRRDTSACPQISFRGTRSIMNQGNPSVYVDGTLVSDTCVLLQIMSSDVDVVEVYPGGLLSDPAIRRNPFGIIIVRRLQR